MAEMTKSYRVVSLQTPCCSPLFFYLHRELLQAFTQTIIPSKQKTAEVTLICRSVFIANNATGAQHKDGLGR